VALAAASTRRQEALGKVAALKSRVAAREAELQASRAEEERVRARIQRIKAATEDERKKQANDLRQYEARMGELCAEMLKVGTGGVAARTAALKVENEQVEQEIRRLEADMGGPEVQGEDWAALGARVDWLEQLLAARAEAAREMAAELRAERNGRLLEHGQPASKAD
jgi:hypothetical protein